MSFVCDVEDGDNDIYNQKDRKEGVDHEKVRPPSQIFINFQKDVWVVYLGLESVHCKERAQIPAEVVGKVSFCIIIFFLIWKLFFVFTVK